MHTSARLVLSDFAFRSISMKDSARSLTFSEAFPNYHPQDRLAIFSPRLEDGIWGSAVAILSLTTGFYDAHRSKSDSFFNYPQHLVFVGNRGSQVRLNDSAYDLTEEEWGPAWGWRDVWPETNWHLCSQRAEVMLDRLYRHQINRVLWPGWIQPESVEHTLSTSAHQLLSNRLKSVWYYERSGLDAVEVPLADTGAESSKDEGQSAEVEVQSSEKGINNQSLETIIEIQPSDSVMDIVGESLQRLPHGTIAAAGNQSSNGFEKHRLNYRFKSVEPIDFLREMAICFTDR